MPLLISGAGSIFRMRAVKFCLKGGEGIDPATVATLAQSMLAAYLPTRVALRRGLLWYPGAGTAAGATLGLWWAQVTGPGRGGAIAAGRSDACGFAGAWVVGRG
jgi:hypothetical protein